MILSDLTGTDEAHPEYVSFAIANAARHYDFLRSSVFAALGLQKIFLSHNIIRALNFHAIACLHSHAGEYRPCEVTVGSYLPPAHYRVRGLMDDFVDEVNSSIRSADPVFLACYVLWRLNYIHPFINGNGRTARACAYFVLCLRAGVWLPGTPILPELLVRERDAYVDALQKVDASLASGVLNLAPLHTLLEQLLIKQLGASISSVSPP